MASDTQMHNLDDDFDAELGLDTASTQLGATNSASSPTPTQLAVLYALAAMFAFFAGLHLICLFITLILGSSASFFVTWAARLSSLWVGIFGSAFLAYLLVYILSFAGTMFKPELFHPRFLDLSVQQKAMFAAPLVPLAILYLVNKGLVSYYSTY